MFISLGSVACNSTWMPSISLLHLSLKLSIDHRTSHLDVPGDLKNKRSEPSHTPLHAKLFIILALNIFTCQQRGAAFSLKAKYKLASNFSFHCVITHQNFESTYIKLGKQNFPWFFLSRAAKVFLKYQFLLIMVVHSFILYFNTLLYTPNEKQ